MSQQITFSNVQVRVEKADDGSRVIVIQDFVTIPAGERSMQLPTNTYVLPLDKEIAAAMAADLKSSDIVTAPASALRALKAA